MKCTICKQELPDSAFYPSEKSRCKECHKRKKRESYDKTHPKIFMNDKGQWSIRQGRRAAIYWTGNMLSDLKRNYPTTKNKELSEILGVSVRTLIRKARELGLEKDKEWSREVSAFNGFMGYYESKR